MMLELSLTDSSTDQYQLPCRICSQVGLNPVGPLSHRDSESAPPMDLAWCPACSLVQWTSLPDARTPRIIPGSRASVAAQGLVDRLQKARQLGPDSLIVGAAGNIELLKLYRDSAIPVLAIEPATESADLRTICGAFSQDMALELSRANLRADVIHASNSLLNSADLNSVVAGFVTLLKPDGLVVAEVPYLKTLADCVGFNTLDRAELCLYSLTALTQLFGQHGLEIVDAERVKSGGGLLRIMAVRSGTASIQPAVYELLDDEAVWIRDPAFYQSFGETLAPSTHDRWAA